MAATIDHYAMTTDELFACNCKICNPTNHRRKEAALTHNIRLPAIAKVPSSFSRPPCHYILSEQALNRQFQTSLARIGNEPGIPLQTRKHQARKLYRCRDRFLQRFSSTACPATLLPPVKLRARRRRHIKQLAPQWRQNERIHIESTLRSEEELATEYAKLKKHILTIARRQARRDKETLRLMTDIYRRGRINAEHLDELRQKCADAMEKEEVAIAECAHFREQAGMAIDVADILRMDYDVVNDEMRRCEKGWKDTNGTVRDLNEAFKDAREGEREWRGRSEEMERRVKEMEEEIRGLREELEKRRG